MRRLLTRPVRLAQAERKKEEETEARERANWEDRKKRAAEARNGGGDRKRVKKCPHGRIKSHCKECGGSGICPHGRRKSTCKECGGSNICSHGRKKSTCKECGGIGICSHGRIKMLPYVALWP